MDYTFKQAYYTSTGSIFYVGEKYPEKYLLEKLPKLMEDFNEKSKYLVASNKVSFEDVTTVPKTLIGEEQNKIKSLELVEKEDIDTNTIYINEISFDELIKIQGIGEKAATKLVNNRNNKRFENIDELIKIVPTVKWDKYNIVY